MNRTTTRLLVVTALALASAGAEAHGSVKGLGSFFGGVVHPLLEPAQLISILALGLLLGPRLEASRPAEICVAVASVLGGVGVAFGVAVSTDVPLLALSALVGLAVVIARPVPRFAYSVIAICLGLGIGLGSRPDAALSAGGWPMVAGSCLGAPVWIVNLALFVQAWRKPWMQVLIRVFGSWITACCILVLTLVVSGRPLGGATDLAKPRLHDGQVAPLNVRRN